MPQTPADSIQRIADATDRIVRLLAGALLKDLEASDQKLRIARLKSCGLSNTEIAEMLGTTPNTVNVAVHSLRKKKSKRSKNKK